jgi:hypothetical protein
MKVPMWRFVSLGLNCLSFLGVACIWRVVLPISIEVEDIRGVCIACPSYNKIMPENVSNEVLQGLLEKIDALQKQSPQNQAAFWGKPQQSAEPESVSVPISVQTPSAGKVRLYLNFQGVSITPESVNALIDSLINKGIPVDVWQQDKGWGGNKWKR